MKTLRIEFEDIPNRKLTHTPTLTHCRRLLKEGYPPETKLEVTRNGHVDLIIHNIGEGAKLTVKEEPACSFAKYSPPNFLEGPTSRVLPSSVAI